MPALTEGAQRAWGRVEEDPREERTAQEEMRRLNQVCADWRRVALKVMMFAVTAGHQLFWEQQLYLNIQRNLTNPRRGRAQRAAEELEQELAMAQVELAVPKQGDLQAVAFRVAEALEVAAYPVAVAFQYLSSSFYLFQKVFQLLPQQEFQRLHCVKNLVLILIFVLSYLHDNLHQQALILF